MLKITDRSKYIKTIILFAVTYMISYITRINYGAVIVAMEESTGFSRPLLSMAVTGSFITYGIGQIISGLCGDKFPPKKLITIGLIVTVCMNLLMTLTKNPYQMTFVWCINGFAQSFMWPPLVKIMVSLFNKEDYRKATVYVSWGSSVGTIAVYLIAPVIVAFTSWKGMFAFSGICALMMIFVWNKFCCDVPVEKKEKTSGSDKNLGVIFTPVMFVVMLAIVIQGLLRDGITTWMPSYIADTYDLGSSISILTGVVLPIFSIISFNITERIYSNVFKNPLLCSGIIFLVGTASAGMIFLVTGKSAILSVLCSALLTGSMHGVNLILICMVPAFFEKYGNASTASGILNACTYIGSALSTYLIAAVSENMGWNFTISSWIFISFTGALLCLFGAKPWDKKMNT